MAHESLTADTQVVLLLCGRFGGEKQEAFSPLSPREYGDLAKWLNGRGLRPSDLMGSNAPDRLASVYEAKLERKRIEFLLGRGTALALALERWSRAGLWVISRGDPAFPKRMRHRLKHTAPPLLYGAGDTSLLDAGGLAIIGSRDASESALDFTRRIARKCAETGMAVVSGGARGVDAAAMQGATEAGGTCIGVLAADLLKVSSNRHNRLGLMAGRLVLVSPFNPESGFNAGNAMGRNRYIYVLSDQALVVESALRTGGTWQGATENLQHGWVPTFVRSPGESAGNAALIDQGAMPFTEEDESCDSLVEYFQSRQASRSTKTEPTQPALMLLGVQDSGSAGSNSSLPDNETSPDVASGQAAAGHVSNPMIGTPAADGTVADMFQDFVSRLTALLVNGPLAEADIATMLHLEKGQAKVWLKRACDGGIVEKSKKPVKYMLVRQSSLC